MTQHTNPQQEPVRLLFEMTRDDNPRLYDDLIRFNKGTKRLNRLRFLAHEGLMAQHWMMVPGVPATPAAAVSRETVDVNVNPGAARHTNHAFDAPPVGVEA